MRMRTTLTTLAAGATLALASAPAALAQPAHLEHHRTTVTWNPHSGERVVLLHVLHHRAARARH